MTGDARGDAIEMIHLLFQLVESQGKVMDKQTLLLEMLVNYQDKLGEQVRLLTRLVEIRTRVEQLH